MTVAELIEALSHHHPDARVVVIDNSDSGNPVPFPVLCLTEYEPGEITVEY
jgi:hypothetical protein